MGPALFLDVTGFTAMTVDLMQHGKEGAEVLSSLLNDLFEGLIESVQSHGGLITTFAGDAFTAVFPEATAGTALEVGFELQKQFAGQATRETRFGHYTLQARVGLAHGRIDWAIMGEPGRRAYFFRGPAIDAAAGAEHHCGPGEIILDESLAALLPGGSGALEVVEGRYRRPPPDFSAQDRGRRAALGFLARTDQEEIDRKVALEFWPAVVIDSTSVGEFRHVTTVFVSFGEPESMEALDVLLSHSLQSITEFEGLLNLVDFGDKGGLLLVLFGAPVAHEDDEVRATRFALRLEAEFGERVRIGLNSGVAFAGTIGSRARCTYTVAGESVNLAARLMQQAAPGSTCVTADFAMRLGRQFSYADLGNQLFKGFDTAIPVRRVLPAGEGAGFEHFEEVALLGRDRELATLQERTDTALAGGFAGLAFVYGDAGSGKSRLLHELYESRKDQAHFVFLHPDGILKKSLNAFRSYFETLLPGPPDGTEGGEAEFLRQLEGLLRMDSLPEELAHELRRTSSFLAALVGFYWDGSLYSELDARGRHENTMAAIKAFFRARAAVLPTILVFEDLHWADEDSREALLALTRSMDGFALLLVLTARPDDDGQLPGLPADENIVQTTVSLGGLDLDCVRELATVRLGAKPGGSLVRSIASRTAGNAFFVEQFVAYLADNELLEESPDGLVLRSEAAELPAGVQALIMARIDRLRADVKETLLAAAVIGMDFDMESLRALLPEQSGLQACLNAGEGERLWEAGAQERYVFQSSLVRHAAYEMQLKERLRMQHGRLAEYLRSRFANQPDRAADIAYHCSRAEQVETAREFYRLAARHAHENFDGEQAARFYDWLLEHSVDADDRIGVLERKSALDELRGRWSDALNSIDQALAIDGSPASGEDQLALKTRRGELLQLRGEYEPAIADLNRAIEDSREAASASHEARATRALGRTYWGQGRYPEAREAHNRALEIESSQGNDGGRALNLYYLGVVARDRGQYDEALGLYEESLQIYESLGDRRHESYPLYDLAVLHQYRGELDQARESFERVAALYEEIGYRSGLASALLNLGTLALRRGDFEQAVARHEQSLKIARETGEQLAIAYGLFSEATIFYARRDYDATMQRFEESFRVMKAIGARGYYGYVFSYLACVYARLGQRARCLKVARNHFKNVHALGGSDVENGRTHMAVALALAAGTPPAALAPLLDELGKLTGVEASPEAYFDRAIAVAREANYINTLIPALREYASYLCRKDPGLAKLARSMLREAHRRASQAGLQLEQERIADVAGTYAIELENGGSD